MDRRLRTIKRNQKWQANVMAMGKTVDVSTVQDVRIVKFDSMTDVVEQSDLFDEFTGNRRGQNRDTTETINAHAVNGDTTRLAEALEIADKLIDEAIAQEPRLARKPQWVRSDDGIFADAGLVAAGDDSPCYQMTRETLRDQQAAGEPIVVVVSTDDNGAASVEAAGAFIATVRLAQQFRPVHVWWQGAWLREDGGEAGYILHAPLVSNDMDFARVEYVLADSTRDGLSFRALFMAAKVRDKLQTVGGLGRRADRAYMPGAQFVSHGGIKPDAEQVAAHACMWLGWESRWQIEYKHEATAESALQELPEENPTQYVDTRTDAAKRRDAAEATRYYKDQERADKKKAAARVKAVKGSVMG